MRCVITVTCVIYYYACVKSRANNSLISMHIVKHMVSVNKLGQVYKSTIGHVCQLLFLHKHLYSIQPYTIERDIGYKLLTRLIQAYKTSSVKEWSQFDGLQQISCFQSCSYFHFPKILLTLIMLLPWHYCYIVIWLCQTTFSFCVRVKIRVGYNNRIDHYNHDDYIQVILPFYCQVGW